MSMGVVYKMQNSPWYVTKMLAWVAFKLHGQLAHIPTPRLRHGVPGYA